MKNRDKVMALALAASLMPAIWRIRLDIFCVLKWNPITKQITETHAYFHRAGACRNAQTGGELMPTCWIKLIKRMQAQGWHVELFYLALPAVQVSLMRVAERVAHGGHDISVSDIMRRFPRSLSNLLLLFAPLVDQAFCFMNVGSAPILVFQQTGTQREIVHAPYFELLLKEAQL
jgi:predicted ABC-type ATPase